MVSATTFRVPYAEALRTHRLALAVAESARTGRPVALPTGPASRLTAPVVDAGVGVDA
ncbi:hypothetical protein [Micromonospora sp. M42]|uniref:hypothetical protein n=1 Tax=Micromonospora sp. M42 TaxID=457406 RepID=UPI000A4082EC|nr:hypothetical protein [Micromonospora sp. M42]